MDLLKRVGVALAGAMVCAAIALALGATPSEAGKLAGASSVGFFFLARVLA